MDQPGISASKRFDYIALAPTRRQSLKILESDLMPSGFLEKVHLAKGQACDMYEQNCEGWHWIDFKDPD
jgi:hypothetical protein